MQRVENSPGEIGLCRRHEGEWVGITDVQSLTLGISDAALKVACDGIGGEVELHPQRKLWPSQASRRVLPEAVAFGMLPSPRSNSTAAPEPKVRSTHLRALPEIPLT
jgi:hypothetical protein